MSVVLSEVDIRRFVEPPSPDSWGCGGYAAEHRCSSTCRRVAVVGIGHGLQVTQPTNYHHRTHTPTHARGVRDRARRLGLPRLPVKGSEMDQFGPL